MTTPVSTRDLSLATPALRADIGVRPIEDGCGRGAILELPEPNQHFRADWDDYRVLSLLDGRSTVDQLVTRLARDVGERALSVESIQGAIGRFQAAGLLGTGVPGDMPRSGTARPHSFVAFRIPLTTSLATFRLCERLLGWLFNWWGLGLWCAAACAAALTLVSESDRLSRQWSHGLLVDHWWGLAIVWLVLKVIHEAGHAAAALRCGARPSEAGVAVVYFLPMAYVDVSSAWNLPRRLDRVVVALAGMGIETLIAFVLILAWGWERSPEMADWLLRAALLASVNTLVFNLNPLARLDGYHALSDGLRQPNLGERSRAAAGQAVFSLLFGSRPHELRRREPFWVAAFGVASFVWSTSMAITALLAITVWWEGWGLVLAGAGVIVALLPGLWRSTSRLLSETAARPLQGLRALSLVTAACFALAALFLYVPAPWSTPAPCAVVVRDETIVRAPVNAFVEEVLVRAGDSVTTGQLLVRLRNDELAARLRELTARLGQLTSLSDHHLERRDTAEHQIVTQELLSARVELEERRAEWNALEVRSPVNGRVVAESLKVRPGAWVESGTDLLTLGDADHLELVAYVAEEDLMDPLALTTKPVLWTFRLRSGRSGATVPDRVLPRSRVTLGHPALGTPLGGPLAVDSRTGTQDDAELVLPEPRVQVVCSLSPEISRQLFTGETGVVSLTPSGEPLGLGLWRATRKLLARNLESLTGDRFR
jgi:putative peptide zinc metalloprotease protein